MGDVYLDLITLLRENLVLIINYFLLVHFKTKINVYLLWFIDIYGAKLIL